MPQIVCMLAVKATSTQAGRLHHAQNSFVDCRTLDDPVRELLSGREVGSRLDRSQRVPHPPHIQAMQHHGIALHAMCDSHRVT